jgi:protein O-GlcNAc transferase
MIQASVGDLIRAAIPLHQAGRLAEAAVLYDEVLRREPNNHDGLHLKGLIAHQQGRHDEAVDCIGKAVKLRPNDPIFWFNYGNVLRGAGRNGEAVDAYRRAIALGPEFADAYTNMANALESLDRREEAEAARQTVTILRPHGAEAVFRLGSARVLQNDLSGAVEAFRRAIQIERDHLGAHVELASALALLGQTDEAIAVHRRLLAMRPIDAKYHGNMLLCMQYSDRLGAEELFEEHRRWAQKHADPLTLAVAATPKRRASSPLRIGYVSPDFRHHAVAMFFEPILTSQDKSRFETFCYSDATEPDEMTNRLKAAAHHWRDIAKQSDVVVAELIQKDRIDVIVDLTGHTAHNRLLAVARRPAPMAVTYLGYPGTTGMKGMDYRITDAVADPPGQTERYHTETLVRLPGCFLCFSAPKHAPDVSPPPFESAGRITFGSFNHAGKISPTTLGLWSAVLRAVPDSGLILKARGLIDNASRNRWLGLFNQEGIDPARIRFLDIRAIYEEHLAQYGAIDIALDTVPYNGTTTTCEAMWMGLPVITLAGKTHVSRVGASLLASVGLPELIADSPEAFVAIAVKLAAERDRLANLRKTLRERMRSSPLMDAVRFTRGFETAIEQIWASRAKML